MAQPATAAIIVACIFVGIGGAFVGYKIYRKVYYYRQRKAYEETLPPVRQPFSAYVAGSNGFSSIPGSSPLGAPAGFPYSGMASQTGSGAQSTLVSPYSTFGKAGSGSYDALTNPMSAGTPPQGSPSDALVGVDHGRSPSGSVVGGIGGGGNGGPYDRTRNSSRAGSITASHYDSAPHSPTAASAHLPGGVRDTRSFDAGSEFGAGSSVAGSQHLHSRSLNGSTSSTMALRKSYTPSVYKGSSTSHIGLAPSHAARRESYLPHNPWNREAMMIVPPQPLGFGTVNSMAMGTDQKTLAFSSISGIGASDDFSNHFSWTEPNSGGAPADGSSAAAPTAAATERERYLREGPSAGLSRTSSPGARVDSRNSSRSGSDLNARTRSGAPPPEHHGISSSSPTSSSARLPQYPPSAAQFRGLHHFAMHHQSHGSVSGGMPASDSASNNAHATIEESPIMSPYRVQGAVVIPGPASTEANRAALSHDMSNAATTRSSASGSDRVSASISQTGSGTGMEDPSTGPTTAYTGSSGRPSRSSGSFKDDGGKMAQDGATGPEDPPPESEKAPGVVSSAAHYGAGLISHAGQRLRAAAGA